MRTPHILIKFKYNTWLHVQGYLTICVTIGRGNSADGVGYAAVFNLTTFDPKLSSPLRNILVEMSTTDNGSVERIKTAMRDMVRYNDARDFFAYGDQAAENLGHHHLIRQSSTERNFHATEAIAFPDGYHTIHHLFGEGDFVTLNL